MANSKPFAADLKAVRTARARDLDRRTAGDLHDAEADWEAILERIESWQLEAALRAKKARERLAGPCLSAAEAKRNQALQSWVSRGCRLEDWAEVLAAEPAPREVEAGGWLEKRRPRSTKQLVTADIRGRSFTYN